MTDDKEHTYFNDFLRFTILPWAIWAAVFLGVTIGLALYSGKAFGEEIPVYVVEHHQGVKMRLMPSPCTDGTSLMMIIQGTPQQYHSRFKSIKSEWLATDGKWHAFDGCWMELSKDEAKAPDSVFVLVFSDGSHYTLLKKDLLQRKPGA